MKVIAEWGQTNRGSVETAIYQAKVAADAGCWAAKWQLLTPSWLASDEAPAYWQHAKAKEQQRSTFTKNGTLAYDEWEPVVQACDNLGLVFLATPFDLQAVEALAELNVPAVKIASGDITYRALLEAINRTGLEVLLSTGASSKDEINRALEWLDECEVTLLACDLVYPCPMARANLARVEWLRRSFDNFVGYSDHTAGCEAAVAAGALGASVLEKHVTLDRLGGTPDDEMGLPFHRLAEYTIAAKDGEELRGMYGPGPSLWEGPALVGARRSWHAITDLRPGDRIDGGNVRALRPCPPGTLPVSVDPTGLVVELAVKEGRPVTLAAVGLADNDEALDSGYPAPL